MVCNERTRDNIQAERWLHRIQAVSIVKQMLHGTTTYIVVGQLVNAREHSRREVVGRVKLDANA